MPLKIILKIIRNKEVSWEDSLTWDERKNGYFAPQE